LDDKVRGKANTNTNTNTNISISIAVANGWRPEAGGRTKMPLPWRWT
jgi:hypothetical protein